MVRPDRVDAEGELLDHVVDEVDRACLIVPRVDLQRANASRLIDRRALEAPDGTARLGLERQELQVDLDVAAWGLPGLAPRE